MSDQRPAVGEPLDDVFDDHDRAIDDDAEVDRAETQQRARDAGLQHAAETEQHRHGNCHGHDQPARRSPRNTNRMMITSNPPSSSCCRTVSIT